MPINVTLRVKKHRALMKAMGFRPIQIWVLDTKRLGFKKECRRQSLLLFNDSEEKSILNFIESISDNKEWI